jgi:PHD/YefM family antitoxin component YafN of YafNO toxin-antitoxin module
MTQLQVQGEHKAAWVTISTDEYDSMRATIEALSDPELMDQLRKSQQDIKAGRTRSLDDFAKEAKKS